MFDEMSLIELTEMAKTLQIDTEHVTFFYSGNGINDCNSIAMMSTDLHTLELVNYVDGDRIVGIFIDHGHGHGTPSEGDSSRRLPDIEEGLEYMGDDIEGDMNEGEERQRVEKSEAQSEGQRMEKLKKKVRGREIMMLKNRGWEVKKMKKQRVGVLNNGQMSDDSDDEQSIGNDSCYSDGLVDSELGIGDNESDFGIEVNWGGVGGKGKSSQSMKSNKGKGKEVDKHGGFAVFNSNLDNGDPQFEVGLCFPDTQSFRDAVRQHSIINARDVVFTKNDKNKVQVKCKHDTCKWYIFASKIHGEDTMQVKTLHNEHQCTRVERVSAANSKWLANKYKDKLRTDPKWPVDSMMSVMQKECKLLFSKFQMYRAKEKVAKMSAGSEEQQYGLLWRFCVMHLYNNFKLAHKGLGLKMMLWKAAKATRVVDFEKIMNELRGKDLEAFKWLAKRPAAQWSRSYFRCNAKCDILLNNMCESFNATIVEARSRPIVDMLETIRMMLMKRVYVKRDQIKKHKGKLTPNIQKLIEELKKKKHGKWQLTGIPCAHAISGMYFMGYKPEDYVHEYYHKSNFLRVYNHLMMPLLGPEEWPHSDRPTLLPPISERMPGRPKKQDRRKTLDEMKNKKDEVTNCGEKRGKLGRQGLVMTCKTCHVAGHNKRTCPQNRKNKQPEEHVEVPPGFKPKKEKRKADVLSQESKLTTSRRPLTRSVAALQGKQVEVLPLSQSSVTGPGTPSKTRKKMMVISKAKQGRHNSPSTQQKKKKKTIENVAAASPSKNAASADPSKITVPESLSKTAASASPSKAPILASRSKTTAPASLSKTTASASHSKAPISASHSKTTASAGHAASPSPSTAANQDIHFELPPGCSQQ
ncbi:UNVERIFIED_CONTAM: hypothetical protein Sradi_1073300 [Sesamum radiatum]|uniref:Transposase MuDR plant domain-containing protein n=1 Tax=Sesamum radiatum TaxID=300843 RepID=A0AAW2VA59_SESRA